MCELLEVKVGDDTRLLLELAEEYRRRRAEEALERLREIDFDSSYEEVRLKLRLRESR